MGALTTITTVMKAGDLPERVTTMRSRFRSSRHIGTVSSTRPVTVGELLSSIQRRAFPSVLIGVCADGLPFLIELGEPEMGAILVSCEKGTGKTHQLQVMADSALRLNGPSDLQLGVLTFKPSEWQAWEDSPRSRKYLQGIYAWYDPWAESFIQNLVELAEARQEGRRLGANVLVILDDLNFIEELSYEAQVNLHWLLEYGSQSDIWLVGAINAHQASNYRYWVEPFRTRIIGRVASGRNAEIIAMRPCPGAEGLPPGDFRIWSGHHWRIYRLPLLGD